MMETSDAAGMVRVVAGLAVLAGLAASIASCSGDHSNVPSTTPPPTMTITTTQSPTRRAAARADREEHQPHRRKPVLADDPCTSGADGHPRKQRKHRIEHRE